MLLCDALKQRRDCRPNHYTIPEQSTLTMTAATDIRCHYEVLGVERSADAATIKKAHRKMALKLHPDKNIGDDSAAEQFRLVQQAYVFASVRVCL